MSMKSRVGAALLLLVVVSKSEAVVIDNFEEGDFSIFVDTVEPGVVDIRSGLQTDNVIGGRRRTVVDTQLNELPLEANVSLTTTNNDGAVAMSITEMAPSQLWVTFEYGGSIDAPPAENLEADLTANGHNAFLVTFSPVAKLGTSSVTVSTGRGTAGEARGTDQGGNPLRLGKSRYLFRYEYLTPFSGPDAVLDFTDVDHVGFLVIGAETDSNTLEYDLLDIRTIDAGPVGDMDCDGDVDFDDIGAFVLALNNPQRYENVYGVPSEFKGDTDADSILDFDDIAGIVDLLNASPQAVPEPSAHLLFIVSFLAFVKKGVRVEALN